MPRSMTVLLTALLVASPTLAATIEITVKAWNDGAAVEGATVGLTQVDSGQGATNKTTNAQGVATFDNVDVASYVVTAMKGEHEAYPLAIEVKLAGDNVAKDMKVAVNHEINGVVKDTHNDHPIAGAKVELTHATEPDLEATTDAKGRYRFDVANPATYTLKASKAEKIGSAQNPVAVYAPSANTQLVVGNDAQTTGPTFSLKTKTVVLVHGVDSNHTTWAQAGDGQSNFVTTLQAADWAVLDDIDLPGHGLSHEDNGGTAEIAKQLDVFAKEMKALIHTHGVRSFWIVAHSQGGIVSRHWLEPTVDGVSNHDFVVGLVTLGTPHHGSPLAKSVYAMKLACAFGAHCPDALRNQGHAAGNDPKKQNEFKKAFFARFPSAAQNTPDGEFLRKLNQGAGDKVDWTGLCSGQAKDTPKAETTLAKKPHYAVVAADGLPAKGFGDAFVIGHGQIKEFSKCDNSDGVVPVISSHLFATRGQGDGNLRNYVLGDLNPSIRVHHKLDPVPTTGLTNDGDVHAWVIANLLDKDPAQWPASTQWPPGGGLKRAAEGDWSHLCGTSHELNPFGAVAPTFLVDTGDTLRVRWQWEGTPPTVTLMTPSGGTIDPAVAAGDPDITYIEDGTVMHGGYWITLPEPGTWTADVADTSGVDSTSVSVTIGLENSTRLDFQVHTDFDDVLSDRVMTATLESPGSPPLVSLMRARWLSATGLVDSVDLRDDGFTPDDTAFDGIYSEWLPIEPVVGHTAVTLEVTGTNPTAFRRLAHVGVPLPQACDLSVLPPLDVQPFDPVVGDALQIAATVDNSGPFAVDVEVTLRDETFSVVRADTVNIGPGGFYDMMATVIPVEAGDVAFQVIARPIDVGHEVNGSNNAQVALVTVAPGSPGVGIELDSPAEAIGILGAYPNPFNPRVTIAFSTPSEGRVELYIADVAGRVVRRLMSDVIASGPHEIPWDGRDRLGVEVASGVYFVHLKAEGSITSRKVALLR